MSKATRLYIFSILCAGVLAVHFILLLTAIGFDFREELHPDAGESDGVFADTLDRLSWEYMHPVFTQNWFLFAPNPVNPNETIFVRGYYPGTNGTEMQSTDWLPIHEEIREGLQRNRFSAMNFYRNTFSQVIDPIRGYLRDAGIDAVRDLQEAVSDEERYAFGPISRYSSYFLQRRYPDTPFAFLEVRVAISPLYRVGWDRPRNPPPPTSALLIRHLPFLLPERGEQHAARNP